MVNNNGKGQESCQFPESFVYRNKKETLEHQFLQGCSTETSKKYN